MDPSDESTKFETLFFSVLKDEYIRKWYNKTLDWGKKYQKKYVNVGFLKSCIENDVVPPSFMISNQPKKNSEKCSKKWTSAAKQASMAWIRMTIAEEEKHAKEEFEHYKDNLKQFAAMIPEVLREFLAQKC